MAEQESLAQVREGQEASRSKSGKGKAIFKRSGGGETPPPRDSEGKAGRPSVDREAESPPNAEQDPHVIARIQQRAYRLFETGGFEHGHDLEHWLEAERQIGSTDRPAG
jgi:hypothetical protein